MSTARRSSIAALLLPAMLLTTSGCATEPAGNAAQVPDPAIVTVLDLVADNVFRIVVRQGTGQAELVREVSGRWRAAPGTPPDSALMLTQHESLLLPLRAYRVLDNVTPTEKAFGLDDRAMQVVLDTVDGDSERVRLGAQSFSGAGVYALREGDQRVFLVLRNVADLCRALLSGTPMPAGDRRAEIEALERAGRTEDREEVVNPWLRQVRRVEQGTT